MTYRNDPYDPKQAAAARPGRARRRRRAGREGVRRRRRPRRARPRCKPAAPRRPVRRSRWPAARSARCRRRRSPTRASGSTRPAPRSRPPTTPGWPSWRPSGPQRVLRRGARRRHAAVGPPPARRPPPADHADGARRRPVRRHGLRDRRGPRGRAGVGQLRRAQHPGRPPGPRPDGHVLGRGRRDGATGSGLVLRTHTSPVQARTMLTRKPPIYVIVPGPGLPHRRARRHPLAGLPPGRGPRRGQGHHDGPPQGHAGPLRPGDVRRRGARTRWRPHYFPFTEPSAEFDVWFAAHRDGPRGSSGAAAAWSTRTCCAPAASTRRCTPDSRSAWASSGR